MKSIRIMYLFAAAAMLLAGCGKETTVSGTGIGNPEPHTDYLICDNTSYAFVEETTRGEAGFYQVVLTPADSSDDFLIKLKVKEDNVNTAFDLLHATDASYSLSVVIGEETSFFYEAFEGNIYSILGGQSYDDASAIGEGCFFTQLTDVDYCTEVDVLLANGHRIRIGTVTPVDSIHYDPYCGGEGQL